MLKRRKILAPLFVFLLFFSCSRNPDSAEVTTEDACVAAALVLKGAGCQRLDAVDKIFVSKVSLANCH